MQIDKLKDLILYQSENGNYYMITKIFGLLKKQWLNYLDVLLII